MCHFGRSVLGVFRHHGSVPFFAKGPDHQLGHDGPHAHRRSVAPGRDGGSAAQRGPGHRQGLDGEKRRAPPAPLCCACLIPCQFTYLECIANSNSATGTALNYLGQMMILLYVCFVTRRLPTRWEITALLLAFLGVFFLATHGDVHTLVLSPQALFWGLIGAVMVVVYNTLPQRLLRVYGSPVITGWGMLLGGVILGLLSRVWTQKVTLDPQTVMWILLIGVVGTAMAFTLYLQGVNDIGPVKTSLLSCAELVTAGVLTSVWLKTPLAWQDVLGMALILGMVAFLAVPGRTTPNTTRSNS